MQSVKLMTMKAETIHEVLLLLHGSYERATTPSAVARKVKSETVSASDVEHFIGVLKTIPAIELVNTASGRIKGLVLKFNAQGVCGERYFRRSPYETLLSRDGGSFAVVADSDYATYHEKRDQLRAIAAEHGMPYLVHGCAHENIQAIVPLVEVQLTQTRRAKCSPS